MTDTYNNLADLLEYPNSNWDSQISVCADDESLNEFRSSVGRLLLNHLQELYTRTFDLNPICSLEIGYHLFGQNYKRGEFLANLRETEAPFALGQENQLPDYLPVLLRLLKKLDDEELRSSLINECLIPAIEKMLASLKDTDNPYRFLLAAVRSILQSEVPAVSVEPPRFKLRATLPVLSSEQDLLSGFATQPYRNAPLQFNWNFAPENWSVAPESKALTDGQGPSAHLAAEPQDEFITTR